MICNRITLGERSRLPQTGDYKFVVYRGYATSNQSTLFYDQAVFVGTPSSVTTSGGDTFITYDIDGYQYYDYSPWPGYTYEYGDCYEQESAYLSQNKPFIRVKSNGTLDCSHFVLPDYFTTDGLVPGIITNDSDNGGIYTYRMEMGGNCTSFTESSYSQLAVGFYNYNGYFSIYQPNTVDAKSQVVAVKLIKPKIQLTSDDAASAGDSNSNSMLPIYTKEQIDNDVDASLPVLSSDAMTLNIIGAKTPDSYCENYYPILDPLATMMQGSIVSVPFTTCEERITGYSTTITDAEDNSRVFYQTSGTLTDEAPADGLLNTEENIAWNTAGGGLPRGIKVTTNVTAINDRDEVNNYSSETLQEMTLLDAEPDPADPLLVTASVWREPSGLKRGYQATIIAQGNWPDEEHIGSGINGLVQAKYKWRVWRVNGDDIILLDPDNMEGKDYGAAIAERSDYESSQLTVKDIYIDDAIMGNDTKVVKYIIRYYTARYRMGTNLPSSGGASPQKKTLTNGSGSDIPTPPPPPAPAPAIELQAPLFAPPGYNEATEYCVAKRIVEVSYNLETVITGIEDVTPDIANKVTHTRYYSVTGQESDQPFNGINIVVLYMDDGSQTAVKRIYTR